MHGADLVMQRGFFGGVFELLQIPALLKRQAVFIIRL